MPGTAVQIFDLASVVSKELRIMEYWRCTSIFGITPTHVTLEKIFLYLLLL
jgi:hypothetical protein